MSFPTKEKRARAQIIIQNYAFGSAATTLIPFALLNGVVTGWGTLAMVEQLSQLYEITYSREAGQSMLFAVVSGLQSAWLTTLANKVLPFTGLWMANIPGALLNGGLTYAIGQTLIDHFEQEGSLENFEPQRVYAYLRGRDNR